MPQYAEISDLEARWRTLQPEEKDRATIILTDASALVEQRCQSIDKDPVSVGADILKLVVCHMAQRVLAAPTEQPPVDSTQSTAGPFSETLNFTNPRGDLFITHQELILLGVLKQRIGSIPPKIGGTDDS